MQTAVFLVFDPEELLLVGDGAAFQNFFFASGCWIGVQFRFLTSFDCFVSPRRVRIGDAMREILASDSFSFGIWILRRVFRLEGFGPERFVRIL